MIEDVALKALYANGIAERGIAKKVAEFFVCDSDDCGFSYCFCGGPEQM